MLEVGGEGETLGRCCRGGRLERARGYVRRRMEGRCVGRGGSGEGGRLVGFVGEGEGCTG